MIFLGLLRARAAMHHRKKKEGGKYIRIEHGSIRRSCWVDRMLAIGRQDGYDSGHTDSPEEDAEADAYEEAMDDELESRIDRNRHKSAYRRQRIVEKMKDNAPDANKDNVVRTKHAIHELNNLHNGVEVYKPEQNYAMGHGEDLGKTKNRDGGSQNNIVSNM